MQPECSDVSLTESHLLEGYIHLTAVIESTHHSIIRVPSEQLSTVSRQTERSTLTNLP